MAKNDELHVLIHSLSRSEKRYFKLFCGREASGGNYLKLFDEIDRQAVYKEAAIKKKFAKEKFVTQLHVTKHYLRNLILKSLRNFHSGISKDAELKDLLRNVEILFNKELFGLCETELKRAESIALKYELISGYVEVKSWMRKLEQAQEPHHYAKFRELLLEQKEKIKLLQNTNAYWQLAVEMSSNGFRENNGQLNTALLHDSGEAKTTEAKALFYNITYLKALQNYKEKEAEETLLALINLLEKQPERLKEEPGPYVSAINNLLSFLAYQRRYKDSLELVSKAKTIYKSFTITTENRVLLKQILRTYNIELEIYRSSKMYVEKAGFISSTEAFVNEHVNRMPKEYLISFWFQLANIHFMKKDFSKSLHWVNLLLNTGFKNVRQDLQLQARMLNLMIHLEQQNLFVLRYYVDSTRRYMKKIQEGMLYQELILKFFVKIGNLPLPEYRNAFEALQKQLFPDQGEALVPAGALDYIDYQEWIEGKLKGK